MRTAAARSVIAITASRYAWLRHQRAANSPRVCRWRDEAAIVLAGPECRYVECREQHDAATHTGGDLRVRVEVTQLRRDVKVGRHQYDQRVLGTVHAQVEASE